jgi:hypothetical protein
MDGTLSIIEGFVAVAHVEVIFRHVSIDQLPNAGAYLSVPSNTRTIYLVQLAMIVSGTSIVLDYSLPLSAFSWDAPQCKK